MRCPFCKKNHDKVIDSRSANAGATVRRRRECLACKKRFTTYEKVEEITLYVIKKDGRRDVFDREKIKRGLLTACKKRPVSLQTIEDIVNRIEIELYENYDREVKSTKIGDLVMRSSRESTMSRTSGSRRSIASSRTSTSSCASSNRC